MIQPDYTPAVKRIADEIGELTIGELLALRESVRRYFDLGDEDEGGAGVREPVPHRPSGGAGYAET